MTVLVVLAVTWRCLLARLCAAAFVQDRKAYTGCTDAATPSGTSGREWCYVDAQASAFFAECLLRGRES